MSTPVHALQGALTIHHAVELQAQLLQQLDAGTDTLDLSAVTDCDAAGVQLLLATDRSLRDSGRRLRLQATPAVVAEVLQRCGLQALAA
jgi:anti-anti-sigma factor